MNISYTQYESAGVFFSDTCAYLEHFPKEAGVKDRMAVVSAIVTPDPKKHEATRQAMCQALSERERATIAIQGQRLKVTFMDQQAAAMPVAFVDDFSNMPTAVLLALSNLLQCETGVPGQDRTEFIQTATRGNKILGRLQPQQFTPTGVFIGDTTSLSNNPSAQVVGQRHAELHVAKAGNRIITILAPIRDEALKIAGSLKPLFAAAAIDSWFRSQPLLAAQLPVLGSWNQLSLSENSRPDGGKMVYGMVFNFGALPQTAEEE